MQSLDDTATFGKRVEAANLEWKSLARKAGVAPSTAFRFGTEKSGGRVATAKALMRALEAEEIRIARHLLALPHVRAALEAEAKAGDAPSSTAVRDCA